MRSVVATVVFACLAVPAVAQDRGSFALDAMTTPGRHFGLGYYVTRGFSIRPSLGAGYASGYGATFNLGTDLRWEMLPGRRVSPYATARFNYLRDPYLTQLDATGLPLDGASSNVTRYGGGLGVRADVKYGISLVAEGLVMNSALRDVAGSYGQQTLTPGTHFEAAAGLSYILR